MEKTSSAALPVAAALVTAAAVFAVALGMRVPPAAPEAPATIGVEHATPMRLSLTVSEGKTPGILELSHDGKEPAFLSVPAEWSVREVRDGRFSDLAADPPSFGFIRRRVPGRLTLSFLLPSPPTGLLVQNPTGVALQVRVRRVNMQTGTTSDDVVLLKDGPKRVW
jgi:hypothetical protein